MRRRFDRPLRRLLRRGIPPLLINANQSIAAGNFAGAADDFEQLARAAEGRGGRRAPMIRIQAGRARLLAGQPDTALENIERGLGLLAARGRLRRLARLGNRMVAEFHQRGYAAESQKLADYLENLSPGFGAEQASAAPARHAPLPTHCPGCGAPVHPDEVEWLDDVTAECPFCGSPLRQE
jgi:hypothetical protein